MNAAASVRTASTVCRMCGHNCPVTVEIEHGRAVRVSGIEGVPMYEGYTCVKGRALPELHAHPDRLLHSQKRMADGSYEAISSEQLMDEVAERLSSIIDRHGPESFANYIGTMAFIASPLVRSFVDAFTRAIGTTMRFDPDTLDQAGKHIARALHGMWMAPPNAFVDPDVGLLVGANPLVSHAGMFPAGHPGKWLKRWMSNGFQLIVVDPRRTDIAKRALIHLQPRPGEDAAIIAGILRVILSEGLGDQAFVADNVDGVEALRRTVDPFTPDYVAARADIDPTDLVRAARIFAAGRRGVAVAGTGPSMSGTGTLVEYLILCLDTVCGRWLRAGDRVPAPSSLSPAPIQRAQARPPYPAYGLGAPLPGSGLMASVGGNPLPALPKAILHRGEGSVRALISCGGNPLTAWPDQLQTIEAMSSLDLLVQVDIKMSATAKFAHYVVAPKMSLETVAMSISQEYGTFYGVGYIGFAEPWAQYARPVVESPPGSDLIEEWEFYYGLAQRLGLPLTLTGFRPAQPTPPIVVDMVNRPTTDDIYAAYCTGGRISLDEIKQHPDGAVFHEPAVFVEPKEEGWNGRLDVGNDQMMHDLTHVANTSVPEPRRLDDGGRAEFRMVTRRMQPFNNSSCHDLKGSRLRPYNPAFLHSSDLDLLGVEPGMEIEISSPVATVVAIAEVDDNLRPGLVSITHGFGGVPAQDDLVRTIGTSVARLLTTDRDLEPYVGQPLMSNVPVSIQRRVARGGAT